MVYAALAVPLVRIGGLAMADEGAPADSLAVTSSSNSKLGRWVAHTHVLYVPMSAVRTPPSQGVTLHTTRTFFHSHQVVLMQDQLLAVARGGTVLAKDTSDAHTYAINLSA